MVPYTWRTFLSLVWWVSSFPSFNSQATRPAASAASVMLPKVGRAPEWAQPSASHPRGALSEALFPGAQVREGQLSPFLTHPMLPVPHDVTCPPGPGALCGVPRPGLPCPLPPPGALLSWHPLLCLVPRAACEPGWGWLREWPPCLGRLRPSSWAMQSCPVWGLGNGVAGGGAGTPARRPAWPSCEMSRLFQALPSGDSSHHWPSCQCKHEGSSFQGSGC